MSRALTCVGLIALVLSAACGEDPSPAAGTASPRAQAEESTTPSTARPAPSATGRSSTTTAPSTSNTVSSDISLIHNLWLGWSEAWEDGPAGGAAYLKDHNYSPYQKDSDYCRRLDEDRGVQRKVFAYDDDTIKRDQAWTIPEGSQKGRHPSGRIYSMDIRQLVTSEDGNRSVTGSSHVTIDDGRAYVFQDCRYFFDRDSAQR